MWERHFPGCTSEFMDIFGTELPTLQDVAKWKATWVESTDNCTTITGNASNLLASPGIREHIHQTCFSLGIHPYYWEYWKERTYQNYDDYDYSCNEGEIIITPKCSFYYDSHLIMFKMAWDI